MARMRLLDLTRPFASLLPEVTMPYSQVDQQDRLLYTVGAAVVFALLSEMPLYAAPQAMDSADPIGWLRPVLGMSHGSLAELGLLPVVLSGVIVQILAALRKINVSLDLRSDRVLFQTLQKSLAFTIAAIFSIMLAFTPGYYGNTAVRGVFVAAQLLVGSTVLILLDEILGKDYGLVPGCVLFPLVSASQYFTWQLLGMQRVPVSGTDYTIVQGVIPSLVANFSSRSYAHTLSDLVFRTGAPNLLGVTICAALFCVTLYLALIRLNLPIRSTRMRAQSSSFPIRLLYTGVVPVLFVNAVLAALLLISYSLSRWVSNANPAMQVLGQWDPKTGRAIGGLATLLAPAYSRNLLVVLLRIVTFSSVLALSSAYVANLWTRSSGFAPQDIAKQFKENSIVLVGKRDVTVAKELRHIVPLAATVGGAVLGLLVGLGDSIGPAGAGSIMSVAALNVFSVFEVMASEGLNSQEKLQNLMSM